MRVSLPSTKEEYWSGAGEEAGEELLNEQDGIVLAKEDISGAAVGQEFREEEAYFFDQYEPHSSGTSATSPCPPSPTTPTLTRSSTSSDCSQPQSQPQQQQQLQSPPAYVSQQMSPLPTVIGMTTISPDSAIDGSFSDFETTNKEYTKRVDPICALPVELLVIIFRYALDSEWMYDRFIEVEDYADKDDVTSIGFNALRTAPLTGKDGEEVFCLTRVELQLSHVCKMWRSIFMERCVDTWEHPTTSNCLVVTGPQWFHPSFPMSMTLNYYTHINLTFSNFPQPTAQQYGNSLISEGYDEALFDPPEGANYHDEVPRGKRYGVDSVVYIRIILNNNSNVALDKVLEFIDFPMQNGALKLITTVNSGSRFFVSERYSKGLMGPVTGGYAHHDDGYRGNIEEGQGDGINAVFEINSWMEGCGWEIGEHIGDFSRWLGGGVDLSYQQQFHHQEMLVKLLRNPQTETVVPKWSHLSSKIGWKDAVAAAFTSNGGERNVWTEWDDNMCCKEERLHSACCHRQQYDYARLEGFEDEQQALRFEILRDGDNRVLSLRRDVVLMLHPFMRVYYGGGGDGGYSFYQPWDQPQHVSAGETLCAHEDKEGLKAEGSQVMGCDPVYDSVRVGFGVGVKVLGISDSEGRGGGCGGIGGMHV